MEGFEHYKPLKFFTVTQLVLASRCLRKYFYNVGCLLELASDEKVAAKFGEAIHAALPLISAEKDFEAAFAAFSAVWAGTTEDVKRNNTTAKLILADFYASHRPGLSLYELTKPPRLIKGVKNVSDYEIPFAINLPGIELPLIGRIDGIGKHRDTGETWGVEYKTASEQSSRLMEAFDMNPQIWCYTLALRTLLDKSVKGMMVETLLVSKTRQSTMLKPVYVFDWQLERFIHWAQFWASMILHCEKTQNFPQMFNSCSPYPMYYTPGYMCEYKYLCGVENWTTMKEFYKVGKPHLPFEIGDISTDDVKVVEASAEDLAAAKQIDTAIQFQLLKGGLPILENKLS